MRKICKDKHYIHSQLLWRSLNGKKSCTWGHLKSDLSQVGGSVYCEAAHQIALKARGGAKRPKKIKGNQSAKWKKNPFGFTLFSQGFFLDQIHFRPMQGMGTTTKMLVLFFLIHYRRN